MKILRVLLLTCFSAAYLFAQGSGGSLDGVVRGPDGLPLGGAEVRVVSALTGAVRTTDTDENGKYGLAALGRGRYVITAAGAEGDRLLTTAPLEITISDGPNRADLMLTEDHSVFENVLVTVSAGSVQPISEVSKSVDVIGREELEARNEISVVDSLRTVPGFRVQQFGGFGTLANIKTRGLQEQATSVLVDGLRFRDPAAITGDASPFLADLLLPGIDRIEVLRGSGSSVYGSNAIGGVVDLRSADPGTGVHGRFSGDYGGLGLRKADGGLSGGKGPFGFSADVTRTVYTEGIDGEDDAKNTGFRGRIDYRPAPSTEISGRFYASRSRFFLNSNPDTLGDVGGGGIVEASPGVNFVPDANDPDSIQQNDLLGVQVRLEQLISSRAVLRISYQGLETDRENVNGPLGPGFQPFGGNETSRFNGRIDTLTVRADWSPNAANTFYAGYEFESEDYGNSGIGPSPGSGFTASSGQSSSSFYVQHLAGLFDQRLQLAGGFRAQVFSVGDTDFSAANPPYGEIGGADPPAAYTWDGAAAWFVKESGTKLKVHAGNGYRVPSLYERLGTFYSSFSQGFVALGDPGLKPERSVAVDAGIEQDLAGGRANASAVFFYTEMTDIIGFGSPVPDIGSTARPFGGYRNEEGAVARGVEISFRSRPAGGLDLFGSYTYTNSDQRTPEVAGSGVVSTLSIPDHQFTFVATKKLFDRLQVGFDLVVTSDYLAPIFSNTSFTSVLYRFGGSRRGDLSARYEIPVLKERARIVIRGSVDNLFGDDYFENGFRTPGRTGRAGVGLEF